jgi:hypothetical protein
MHISYEFEADLFEITRGGIGCSAAELLDWDRRDRLGIVVRSPAGALDASLLILLAGVAFYDFDPIRRRRTLYPDMFLFHAGGPYGSHQGFDFAPLHKEVFVPSAEPGAVLEAVNHAGVTHLLLPDRFPETVDLPFKEPEAAIDRIKQIYVYAPDGAVADADVTIATNRFDKFAPTLEAVLDPNIIIESAEKRLHNQVTTGESAGMPAVKAQGIRQMLNREKERAGEIDRNDPERLRHVERVARGRASNRLVESYRRINIHTALTLL